MTVKRCYIDVETGGVDSEKCALLQIAGIVEIDGKVEETFELKIKPFPNDFICTAALEVTGYSLDTIQSSDDFLVPREAYLKLIKILKKYVDQYDKRDKFSFVGYNSNFDIQFVRSFFLKNGDTYYGSYFWNSHIDVMVMAHIILEGERANMEGFKLVQVAEHFGIDVDESKAHDALYDIELTRDIYRKITDAE